MVIFLYFFEYYSCRGGRKSQRSAIVEFVAKFQVFHNRLSIVRPSSVFLSPKFFMRRRQNPQKNQWESRTQKRTNVSNLEQEKRHNQTRTASKSQTNTPNLLRTKKLEAKTKITLYFQIFIFKLIQIENKIF